MILWIKGKLIQEDVSGSKVPTLSHALSCI